MRKMKFKNLFVITMIVSCLFYINTYSIEAADVIITDGTGDVCSIDFLTGETKVITNHSDIEVDNLDLIQATYTKQGIQATLSLQVVGNIENRGNMSGGFIDVFEFVQYEFQLITSGQYYMISYCNRTGQLIYDDEQINLTSSDFSVVGDTLSITLSLVSADEIYENLSVSSVYLKANFSEEEPVIVFLADIAPNPPLMIFYAYTPDVGYAGENIQFNASVEPLTGTLPYTYHWDFGDQSSSIQLNPTHTYTKVGVYTYTFTVTDNAGATASLSDTITIKELRKAFLFGRFINMNAEGNFISVEAVNLRMILFKPFQFFHYVAGQNIIFLNEYKGLIISNKFLVGMFNVVIDSEPTPSKAYATDAPVNNTAILLLQRFWLENIFNSRLNVSFG